jgi:hypothetical protein
MKKFLFTGIAVTGIVILEVVNVNLSNKSSNISGVALKNLEALTGESGKIPAKLCYTANIFSNKPHEWKLKCPVENDQTGIGDCPVSDDFFIIGSTDRCHNTTASQ